QPRHPQLPTHGSKLFRAVVVVGTCVAAHRAALPSRLLHHSESVGEHSRVWGCFFVTTREHWLCSLVAVPYSSGTDCAGPWHKKAAAQALRRPPSLGVRRLASCSPPFQAAPAVAPR